MSYAKLNLANRKNSTIFYKEKEVQQFAKPLFGQKLKINRINDMRHRNNIKIQIKENFFIMYNIGQFFLKKIL